MNIYLKLQPVTIVSSQGTGSYHTTVGLAAAVGESRDNLIYMNHRYKTGWGKIPARIVDYKVDPFNGYLTYMFIESIDCEPYNQRRLTAFDIERYVHTVEPYLAVDILAYGGDRIAAAVKRRMILDGDAEEVWRFYKKCTEGAEDCSIGHFGLEDYEALLLEARTTDQGLIE